MELLDPARRPFLEGGSAFLHGETPPVLDRNAAELGKDWRMSQTHSAFTFGACSSVSSLNLSRNGKNAAWSVGGPTPITFHRTRMRSLTFGGGRSESPYASDVQRN